MGTFNKSFTDLIVGEFQDKMTDTKAKKQIKLLAEDLNQFMINRILLGRDIDNRIFKPLSKGYTKTKRRFITGNIGKSKSLKKIFKQRVNKYRAKNVPNFIRLSGRLLKAIRSKVKSFRVLSGGKGIMYSIEFSILDSQQEKAEWVTTGGKSKKRREFFGLGRAESLKKKQKEIINARLSKIFKTFK